MSVVMQLKAMDIETGEPDPAWWVSSWEQSREALAWMRGSSFATEALEKKEDRALRRRRWRLWGTVPKTD